MDILPLQFKPKTETPLALMKKVHANDVYNKSQLLKQQAKLCCRNLHRGALGSGSPGGHICEVHPSFNVSNSDKCSPRAGYIAESNTNMATCLNNSLPIIESSNNIVGGAQEHAIIQEKEHHSTIDLHVSPAYSLTSPKSIKKKQLMSMTSEQQLAAEYSHFQNVTLAKELADSRTISLDRTDLYTSEQEPTVGEKESGVDSYAARQTILSRHDFKQTHDSCREMGEGALGSAATRKEQLSIDKKSYVNAEIIGSLKSGYGFLPNFSVPNNQGSRSKRQPPADAYHQNNIRAPKCSPNYGGHQQMKSTAAQINKMRIFARSPETTEISMNLSPLERRRKEQSTSIARASTKEKRAISSDYIAANDKGVQSVFKKSEVSYSRTDNQSQSSRKELKSHKYDEENVIQGAIFNSGMKGRKEIMSKRKSVTDQNHLVSSSFHERTPTNNRDLSAQVEAGQPQQLAQPVSQSRTKKRDSSRQKDYVIDFNSLSLYERYNKLINTNNCSTNQSDASPSFKAAHYPHQIEKQISAARNSQVTQHQQVQAISNSPESPQEKLTDEVDAFSYRCGGKTGKVRSGGGRKKAGRSKKSSRAMSPHQKLYSGNEVTIVVFKDEKQPNERSQGNNLNVSGGIKKINSRGVPIKKLDARLKSLRATDEKPTKQENQLCFKFPIAPLEAQPKGGQSSRYKDISKDQQVGTSRTEGCGGVGIEQQTTVEVIKSSVDKIGTLADNTSEGTNRISATRLHKSQHSAMTKENITGQGGGTRQSDRMEDPEPRRSVEIQNLRLHKGASDARKQNQSKSVDSAGGVSNLHDMLKPKGIEVYSQSIATSDVGTPKDKANMKGMFEVTPQVPNQVELRQSSIVVTDDTRRSAKALEGGEIKSQLMQTPQFNNTDVLIKTFKGMSPCSTTKPGPFLNLTTLDEMKSGEVVTAKLASSNTDRHSLDGKPDTAILLRELDSNFNRLQSEEPDTNRDIQAVMQAEKAVLPHVSEDTDSSHSLMDSIKTSIDDETLMELAKKGITAPTPVYKKRSTLQPKKQFNEKAIDGDSNAAQRLSDTAGAEQSQQQTLGESRASLGKVNMKSTLKEHNASRSSILRRSLQNRPISKSDNAVTNQGRKDEPQIQEERAVSSNRSIIYSQKSRAHKNHSFGQSSPISPVKLSPERKSSTVDQSSPLMREGGLLSGETRAAVIQIASLDTPRSPQNQNDSSQQQNSHGKTVKSNSQNAFQVKSKTLNFRTELSKKHTGSRRGPMKHVTESEAQSQTDFAPLPPLDPAQFSLDAIHGNYSPNLLFVPEEQDHSMLKDLSIAGQLNMGTMQPESIMEHPDKEETPNASKILIGPRPTTQSPLYEAQSGEFISAGKFVGINQDFLAQSRSNHFKLDLNMSAVQTEHVLSHLSPQDQSVLLNNPQVLIRQVNIQTNQLPRQARPQRELSQPERSMKQARRVLMCGDQNDSKQSKLVVAAKEGRRIICKTLAGSPKVMNQTLAEQLSTPKRHHMIACQGTPLVPVTLQQRNSSNREVSKRTARALRAIPRRSNLSKDFQNMTDDLISKKSVERVDKSIGEDTSHSSGSYETKRKYYILNIDNTDDDNGAMVSYNNSKEQDQSSNLPQQTTLDRDQTTPFNCTANSKQNSIMSKQNANGAPSPDAYLERPKAGDIENEFLTDRQLLESSENEKLVLGQMAALSARNNLCQSRQEDLDTIYMQSTIQFNRDMVAFKVGNVSKSPEPVQLYPTTNPFVSEKSQMSVTEKPDEEDELQHGESISQANNLAMSQKLSERRQIHLKNGLHTKWAGPSPANPLGDCSTLQANSIGMSLGMSSGHQQNQDYNLRMGLPVIVTEALPTPVQPATMNQTFTSTMQNQIKIINEQQASHVYGTSLQQSHPVKSGKSAANIKAVNFQKNKYGTTHVAGQDNSESGSSLEKLYSPTAAIKVNKSKPSADASSHVVGTQTDSIEMKKRPKTSYYQPKNSQQQNRTNSPRSRKIIYLMHKRREIALRRKQTNETETSPRIPDQSRSKSPPMEKKLRNSHQLQITKDFKTITGGPPSKGAFFNKVSMQLSRAFSMDRTSTRVASSLAKYFNTHRKRDRQSPLMSESSSVQPKEHKRGYQKTEGGIHLQLRINPCSNTTLNAMRPKSISLKHRNRNLQFAASSLPHSRQNTLTNYFSPNSDMRVHLHLFDSEYMGLKADTQNDFNPISRQHRQTLTFTGGDYVGGGSAQDDQILLESFIQQKQTQRAGLKTAEGGRERIKQNLNPSEGPPSKRVISQASIELKDRFKGFNRRQTHDELVANLKQKFYTGGQDQQIAVESEEFNSKGVKNGEILKHMSSNFIKVGVDARISGQIHMKTMPIDTHARQVSSHVRPEQGRPTPPSTVKAYSGLGDLSNKTGGCGGGREFQKMQQPRLHLKVRKEKPVETLAIDFDNQIKVERIITQCASTTINKMNPIIRRVESSQYSCNSSQNPNESNKKQMMHTESRKRARLQKQNLIYRRNQQQKAGTRNILAKATIEQLLQSGSGSVQNFNFSIKSQDY